MAPTLTNPIPAAVTAGDSIAWAWSDSLHTSGDGWAPTLTLVNAAGRITVSGVASGDAHTLTAAAAATALWAPGTYRAHLAVARAGERETLFAQDLEVLPDPAGAALYDGRSHARRTLDALEAWIESKSPAVASYRIADRQMQYIPIGELLQLRDRYRADVRREDAAARGRAFNKIQVRI